MRWIVDISEGRVPVNLNKRTGFYTFSCTNFYKEKYAFPVTSRGGLFGSEKLKISHCLDNRLIDGGKVVSPTYWPRSAPKKHLFSVSGTHFC
jgi:hypothetical protein